MSEPSEPLWPGPSWVKVITAQTCPACGLLSLEPGESCESCGARLDPGPAPGDSARPLPQGTKPDIFGPWPAAGQVPSASHTPAAPAARDIVPSASSATATTATRDLPREIAAQEAAKQAALVLDPAIQPGVPVVVAPGVVTTVLLGPGGLGAAGPVSARLHQPGVQPALDSRSGPAGLSGLDLVASKGLAPIEVAVPGGSVAPGAVVAGPVLPGSVLSGPVGTGPVLTGPIASGLGAPGAVVPRSGSSGPVAIGSVGPGSLASGPVVLPGSVVPAGSAGSAQLVVPGGPSGPGGSPAGLTALGLPGVPAGIAGVATPGGPVVPGGTALPGGVATPGAPGVLGLPNGLAGPVVPSSPGVPNASAGPVLPALPIGSDPGMPNGTAVSGIPLPGALASSGTVGEMLLPTSSVLAPNGASTGVPVVAGPARAAMLAAYEANASSPDLPVGASSLTAPAPPAGPGSVVRPGSLTAPATVAGPGQVARLGAPDESRQAPNTPNAPQVAYPVTPRVSLWPIGRP